MENGITKSPIQTALAKNNFKVADILLKLNADINSTISNKCIISYLYTTDKLNTKNLSYILNNGFNVCNIKPDFIYEIIEGNKNNLLQIISNHSYNTLILRLLGIFQNKLALSDEQIEEILTYEKGKFIIDDTMYEKAFNNNNYEAMRILFGHDTSEEYVIFRRLNKYNVLENAVRLNNIPFVKNLLKYERLSFHTINFKTILIAAHNTLNLDLFKLLVNSALNDSMEESSKQYDPTHINYMINMAIRIDNFEIVKYLTEDEKYKSSVNLNSKDINGEYPIITAFYDGKFEVFKYLIEHGADVDFNDNGHSLLSSAIDNTESVKYVKYLLRKRVNINKKDGNNCYPLIKAIKKNKIDIVILLIKHANKHKINMDILDKDGNTPLILAYRLNHEEIFRFLIKYMKKIDINKKDSNGNTLLFYTILKEDIETIEYLINNGANVNYKNNKGKSPLGLAISKGYKYLNALLSNNNNLSVNMPNVIEDNPYATIIRLNGYSLKEKEDIIQKLINNGYHINTMDKCKKTPLVYAVQYHLSSIVRLLVENGADINFFIKETNQTLLMYCIERGDIESFKYLIECNADINYQTDDGHTPITWCIKNGNPDALKYLIESGAEIPDKNFLIKVNRENNYSKYCDCYNGAGTTIRKILNSVRFDQ
jgi:ankyrin repeat protein